MGDDAYVLATGASTSTAVGIGGLLNVFKAESAQTSGRLCVIEQIVRRGQAPPLHVHSREDEAWFVLSGEVRFRLGDERHDVLPGSFVFGPRDVPHTFDALSDEARLLGIAVPAGVDRFFHEFPATDNVVALAERYGVRILG